LERVFDVKWALSTVIYAQPVRLHRRTTWRPVFDPATSLSGYVLHLVPGYSFVEIASHSQYIHYFPDFIAFLRHVGG
jgi:hypothetical protein